MILVVFCNMPNSSVWDLLIEINAKFEFIHALNPCLGYQPTRNVSMKIVAKDWKLMIRDTKW